MNNIRRDLVLLLLVSGLALPRARAQETASTLLERVNAAYGGKWRTGELSDWTWEGSIAFFTVDGQRREFPFQLIRKGPDKIQRIVVQPACEIRQGSDGTRDWSVAGPLSAKVTSHERHFMESHTSRSIQAALLYQVAGLRLRHLGSAVEQRGANRGSGVTVLETEDRKGRRTRYMVDPATALIKAIEFDAGTQRNALDGTPVPVDEHYALSDYRTTAGVATPFLIERFRGSVKLEEIRIRAVRYNTGVSDSVFRP